MIKPCYIYIYFFFFPFFPFFSFFFNLLHSFLQVSHLVPNPVQDSVPWHTSSCRLCISHLYCDPDNTTNPYLTHLLHYRKCVRHLIGRGSWGQHTAWRGSATWELLSCQKRHTSVPPIFLRFCVPQYEHTVPWSSHFLQLVLYTGQRPAVIWHSSTVPFAGETCFMQNKRQ